MKILMIAFLIVFSATIYLNDGSYIWVEKYSYWTYSNEMHTGKIGGSYDVNTPIGIKYSDDNGTHLIPFSAIKEIIL